MTRGSRRPTTPFGASCSRTPTPSLRTGARSRTGRSPSAVTYTAGSRFRTTTRAARTARGPRRPRTRSPRTGSTSPSYQKFVYVFPKTSAAPWAGLGGGSQAWLNGTISFRVATHEVGHTLGLGHSKSLSCTQSGASRVPCLRPHDVLGQRIRRPVRRHGLGLDASHLERRQGRARLDGDLARPDRDRQRDSTRSPPGRPRRDRGADPARQARRRVVAQPRGPQPYGQYFETFSGRPRRERRLRPLVEHHTSASRSSSTRRRKPAPSRTPPSPRAGRSRTAPGGVTGARRSRSPRAAQRCRSRSAAAARTPPADTRRPATLAARRHRVGRDHGITLLARRERQRGGRVLPSSSATCPARDDDVALLRDAPRRGRYRYASRVDTSATCRPPSHADDAVAPDTQLQRATPR